MKQRHRQWVAGLLLSGLAAAALAQAPAAPASPAGPRAEMREGRGHWMERGDFRKRMEERSAKRQAALKQKLAITPAQEGAWNAWTASMKPPERMGQRPDRAEFARLTTPERIDRMRALREQRQTRMDARLNATKTFYAALSPQQQKTFDELSLRMLGGKHGHRGGHHHGGFRS